MGLGDGVSLCSEMNVAVLKFRLADHPADLSLALYRADRAWTSLNSAAHGDLPLDLAPVADELVLALASLRDLAATVSGERE